MCYNPVLRVQLNVTNYVKKSTLKGEGKMKKTIFIVAAVLLIIAGIVFKKQLVEVPEDELITYDLPEVELVNKEIRGL